MPPTTARPPSSLRLAPCSSRCTARVTPPCDHVRAGARRVHGATSVPAAEHSTITSWADMSADSDHVVYEAAEYNAFCNMIKQYMSSFAVSLVSDGFNIWNAVANLWPSDESSNGGARPP
eukprot:37664-Prymnesium_polylepis.1